MTTNPFIVTNWDTEQTGAEWDTGLDWDSNIGPSPGDNTPYLRLITSEYNQQPNFMAMVDYMTQPYADLSFVLASMPLAFDLDVAVGDQEDKTGQWIGVSRDVPVPLPNVYFSWDVMGQGWGQANWKRPSDPVVGLVELNDDDYRTLLRARVLANHWDGTIPGAYAAWDALFAGTSVGILIQDYGDMSMAYALTGPTPPATTLALYTGGYLNLKPAGVRIRAFYTPFDTNLPYFAWGVENTNLAGWNEGNWGNSTSGN